MSSDQGQAQRLSPWWLIAGVAVVGLAVWLVMGASSSGADEQPETPRAPDTSPESATRGASSGLAEGTSRDPQIHALLIGCTEYPEFKRDPSISPEVYRGKIQLLGCANDVELLGTTLEERFAVPRANITALAGWPANPAARPTGANIRKAFQALVARTYKAGDRVIVTYSGHGIQQTDDGADEIDGLDEAWLVADARKDPNTQYAGTMRDEEIGDYLRAIRDKGATVWCLMDCCHSATGMRGVPEEPARTRGLHPGDVGVDVRPRATRGLAGGADDSPMGDSSGANERIVTFYAAQSFQEVPEVRLPKHGANRKSYGLLTTAVVRALKNAGRLLTFAELYEQVVAAYGDLGKSHIVQPFAEGDLSQRVFGGDRAVQVALPVRKIKQYLELGAGAIHGLEVGTELDLYPPGSERTEATRVGRVVLHTLGGRASRVRPVKGMDFAWTRQRGPWSAVVTKYVVGKTSIPVVLVNEAGERIELDTTEELVMNLLADDEMRARFPLRRTVAESKWTIVFDAKGRPTTLRPSALTVGAPEFEVDAYTLEETLLKVYRGENLLKLASRDPRMGRLPGNLRLRIQQLVDGQEPKTIQPGQRVTPGSVLKFDLVKTASRGRGDLDTVDVFVFWMDPHFGIDMHYPTEVSGPRLTKDDIAEDGWAIQVGDDPSYIITDASSGLERMLVFAAPKRTDAPQLDLRFLQQPALRARMRGAADEGAPDAAEADPAAELLSDLAFGPKLMRGGLKRVDKSKTKLALQVITFESGWGAIRIPPAAEGAVRTTVASTLSPPQAGTPPDPWKLAGSVYLASAGASDAPCLVVGTADGVTTALIDLDGQAPGSAQTPAGLKELVTARSLDAEMAIRVERQPKRTTIWYDTDDDDTFDLVLVDTTGNLRANQRYRRAADGTWSLEAAVDVPLLRSTYLTGLEQSYDVQAEVLARLHTIAGG